MKPARGQFDSQRPLGRAGQGRFFVVRTRRPPRSAPDAQRSSGFTLVEMLVSTGLVVLIMLLFAQIFGSAIGTMTEQRGMANNDQKARTLSGVLRGDLQNMTYRQPAWPHGTVQGIVPLAAGDDPIIDPANQRGYFYFSENDPAIDWDDVLQFTTMIRSGQRGDAPTNNQQRPYVGKAGSLSSAGNNQPVMDDGISGDGQGQSRAAEICYFLRNGNLYRRVLLLRDPLPASPRSDNQPTDSTSGARIYNGSSTTASNYLGTASPATTFLNDFDYAATRQSDSSGSYPWFHSVASLDNHLGQVNIPIAMTYTRFGFNPSSTNGIPVEYDSSGNFMGRPTNQETSSTSFVYPGSAVNSYTSRGTIDSDGTLSGYPSNDRIGEDLLLTNVEAFDVEVLDPQANGNAGAFVDIGDNTSSIPAVTYLSSQNTAYQASGGRPNIYDSWHPVVTTNLTGNSPPFRPLTTPTSNTVWVHNSPATVGTVYLPQAALPYFSEDVDGDGVLDAGEDINGNSVLNNHGEDANNNASMDSGEDLNSNGILDLPIGIANASLRAVAIQGGTTGSKMPEWPRMPGAFVTDGSVIWQIQDNRVGLKAIRITVRYRDVSSNLSRQVTLVHSFVE